MKISNYLLPNVTKIQQIYRCLHIYLHSKEEKQVEIE